AHARASRSRAGTADGERTGRRLRQKAGAGAQGAAAATAPSSAMAPPGSASDWLRSPGPSFIPPPESVVRRLRAPVSVSSQWALSSGAEALAPSDEVR